jgi:hypothetical protein
MIHAHVAADRRQSLRRHSPRACIDGERSEAPPTSRALSPASPRSQPPPLLSA